MTISTNRAGRVHFGRRRAILFSTACSAILLCTASVHGSTGAYISPIFPIFSSTPPTSRPMATSVTMQFWTATANAMTTAAGWTLRGVAPGRDGALTLAPGVPPLACHDVAIDGGIAAYDARAGFCAGHDPYPAGAYHGRDYYNGGRFHAATLLSPVRHAAPFDHATVSWAADTPTGTWLQAHLRVSLASGRWSRWYSLPVWASDAETVRRHSIDGQDGDGGALQTDTLALHGSAYQLSVTLFSSVPSNSGSSSALRRLSIALSHTSIAAVTAATAATAATAVTAATAGTGETGETGRIGIDSPLEGAAAGWVGELAVPARSQMLADYKGLGYGGGGEAWCSPTSTSMLLAYWARRLRRSDLDVSVPAAAHGVYDWTYDGGGNWPFNVAYATSFTGMDGYVARFSSLATLEPWLAAGVPLALSVSFGPGELPGAPLSSTPGHLLVLRGFTTTGDPIVNDPAAPDDATVRLVYPRAAFEHAWLTGSGGATYVIFPRAWKAPVASG